MKYSVLIGYWLQRESAYLLYPTDMLPTFPSASVSCFFFSNEKGKGMFWITEHLLGENEVQNHS